MIRLKKIGAIQIAVCSHCTREWPTRKKDGPKACRYCQKAADKK